ncbi:DASH complex, subunit Ask1 [Beauveria brongniartii RCEF 3172]|uniref:DASH complex subunit ASK1 n=1 Tax=Beauveria brongniartii RCEF 3172 TaxID=1081107 RepID=A0A167FUR5_9HYPO|nr:DASH complex, subunit Ask1 [Beauveria brongniartii RCEF 3172]
MARPSVAARNFSQTEELERLEQSITLTLQEIDHNFSKAHRIVTTSILPVVEQYGENSRAIWEASKFWKQFFEASANVSLSGYEELANDESTVMEESTAMRDDGNAAGHAHEDEHDTPSRQHSHRNLDHDDDESMLDDAELAGSTPRPSAAKIGKARMSPTESPYEAMRREMKNEEDGETTVLDEEEDSSILFAQQTARLPDVSLTPKALLDQRNMDPSTGGKDPLLHRVLDKNYRIQATPHKSAAKGTPIRGVAATPAGQRQGSAWQDSPASSPEMAIPKLRSEAFMSPYKPLAADRRANASSSAAGRRRFTPVASQGPRTPGISVQTPMSRKTRQALAEGSIKGKQKYEIDWDSDEDDDDLYGGISPPKTIQFALPPSKLLQTPAREASRRIVDDILTDAGANPASSEYSPTMVKMNEDILNDSF